MIQYAKYKNYSSWRGCTMTEFFPEGFWKAVAMIGMMVFFVLGVDLLLGARLMIFLGRTLNRSFQVDQVIVKILTSLKHNSDRQYDMDRPMLNGWGRFVVSGILFFGAIIILMQLLPRL